MLVSDVLVASLIALIVILSVILLIQKHRSNVRRQILDEQEKALTGQIKLIQGEKEQLERYQKEIREKIAGWKQQFREEYPGYSDDIRDSADPDDRTAFQSVYWKEPVINAVILHKLETCHALGIALTFDGFPKEGLLSPAMSITEMIGLFTNLFDNAIEACQMLPEEKRWIRCKACPEGEKQLFVIENSCSETSTLNPGEKTWKSNKQEHGIGKDIINEIVNRNNGWITVTQNRGIYRVEMMLVIG